MNDLIKFSFVVMIIFTSVSACIGKSIEVANRDDFKCSISIYNNYVPGIYFGDYNNTIQVGNQDFLFEFSIENTADHDIKIAFPSEFEALIWYIENVDNGMMYKNFHYNVNFENISYFTHERGHNFSCGMGYDLFHE